MFLGTENRICKHEVDLRRYVCNSFVDNIHGGVDERPPESASYFLQRYSFSTVMIHVHAQLWRPRPDVPRKLDS